MEEKNINTSTSPTKIKFTVIIIIGIIIIIFGAKYATDELFRKDVDTNILKKEISDSSEATIEIDSDYNPSFYAYDNYVVILSNNKLTEYDQNANIVATIDVNISVPIFDSNGKYLLLAEKEGNNIYLINGTNILWQKKLDGDISNININENGYVSIVIKNTLYKSIVMYLDNNGNELFKYYLSNSYVICTAISTNNSYLALGEVNYSGTIIKSTIKIISTELAATDSENSTVYTYNSENGSIITNITYQDKYTAICSFNDYVQAITPSSDKRIYDISQNDLFIDINSQGIIATINKEQDGKFSFEYEVNLQTTSSNKQTLYILNSDLPKSILIHGNNIAINLGNEIKFITTSGIEKKRFTSSKEISNVILGDNIAAIIFKNKIEIIKL